MIFNKKLINTFLKHQGDLDDQIINKKKKKYIMKGYKYKKDIKNKTLQKRELGVYKFKCKK